MPLLQKIQAIIKGCQKFVESKCQIIMTCTPTKNTNITTQVQSLLLIQKAALKVERPYF